jgi:hypothetical protein
VQMYVVASFPSLPILTLSKDRRKINGSDVSMPL